ncbi:MAG: SDR family oxidoreductase [Erythrobacter sp.]|nr:SDR family oxidoreductase [Erythrobacter sp.]
MTLNLTGKTAIITAGAAGIGLSIARRFADLGASLCICDISDEALDEARAVLPRALALRADVARSADIAALYEAFGARHGTLDILVNNAGISGPNKPMDEITDDEWAQTMGVNVTAAFYATRAAVPLFRAAGSGCVINMGSVAGRVGMPLRLPYSVSKFAIRGLTETLAIELGEFGIRVNSILPGLVNGPRGRRVLADQAASRGMKPEAYAEMFLHNISMHSMVEMEEIADMAAFLASDLAPHVSGQSIGVCGNFESYRAPLVMAS